MDGQDISPIAPTSKMIQMDLKCMNASSVVQESDGSQLTPKIRSGAEVFQDERRRVLQSELEFLW